MVNDDDIYPFAILMPVTSRNSGSSIFKRLRLVSQNLRDNQSTKVPFRVYIGIDIGDSELDNDSAEQELKQSIFKGFYLRIHRFQPSTPFQIGKLWNGLAAAANEDNCKYFVLYGDDISVDYRDDRKQNRDGNDEKWADAVHREFEHRVVPFFGVCALNDITSPGFPTFPIVTSLHMRIFDNVIIPEEFVNQDGDPYLWSLYRRYGSSKFISAIELTNAIGGVQLLEDESYIEPRYERQHIDWKGWILQRGIEKIDRFIRTAADLEEKDPPSQLLKNLKGTKRIVLDVIVPSYRVKKEFLLPIIALQVPTTCDVMIIIIVDDPRADIQWLRNIEKDPEMLGKVRVRKNTSNLGASRTRNVGLDESSSDWVLFIDDDVIPDTQLLYAYNDAISEFGTRYDGFVGVTVLPSEPYLLYPTAVHLSGVSFFWTCALKMDKTPWGITANLLFNRSCNMHNMIHSDADDVDGGDGDNVYLSSINNNNMGVRFDDAFIKTGGGEDIDFCLQLRKQPLKCVANALCHHPWWNNGNRCYSHFFRWAIGDSLLIDKYPQFSYRNFPNIVELMVIITGFHFMTFGANRVWSLIRMLSMMLTTDVMIDVYKLCMHVESEDIQPDASGFLRLFAAMESNLIKNCSELGHLIGPIMRGNVGNVCMKFDWFCGNFKGYISKERENALLRFASFILVIILSILI